jgi:zinc D-Ala-D-Ala carboxypeptidase
MQTTSTGLDNTPTEEARANLYELVQTVLDPLRKELGVPIRITSGYRSPQVNAAVGGSRTSRHMLGLAADFKARGYSARDICDTIDRMWSEGRLDFDQAIAYAVSRGGHVHVGLAPEGVVPRRQVLWAPDGGGYSPL